MNGLLVSAIITISLALVFYTIGVWREHKERVLKKIHVLFFGLGLIFDTTGTSLMSMIAGEKDISSSITFNIHRFTGALAIILMLVHFLWAIYVLVKGSEKAKENFHRFSVIVWGFWLIPYLVGMIIGMRG
jgi:uncharacterized repeat protein (TIGR03987 family)